jgi:transcriptional regulator with XRE-family HTH domain
VEISVNRLELNALRQCREEAGITRGEIALKSGINPSYIGQVENDFPNPSDDFLARYKAALKEVQAEIAEQERG